MGSMWIDVRIELSKLGCVSHFVERTAHPHDLTNLWNDLRLLCDRHSNVCEWAKGAEGHRSVLGSEAVVDDGIDANRTSYPRIRSAS